MEQYIHIVSAQNNYQRGLLQRQWFFELQRVSKPPPATSNKLNCVNSPATSRARYSRTGMFQLVQGTPYTAASKGDVYDVIKRIKAGNFKGADYVLFGTVSDIDFTHDMNELANTDSYSAVLGLTLVADFSLINTRTFEITSAFTAMGEGQDTKLVNGRDIKVSLNRPRVVRDVSKALGEDVAAQLSQQLGGGGYEQPGQAPLRNNLPPDTAPVILR